MVQNLRFFKNINLNGLVSLFISTHFKKLKVSCMRYFHWISPYVHSVFKLKCPWMCVSLCLSPLRNLLTEWNGDFWSKRVLLRFQIKCFYSIYHQPFCSCITKPPGTFIAGEAAYSGGQVTGDWWQVPGDIFSFFLSLKAKSISWYRGCSRMLPSMTCRISLA